jgi:hypothetical protein
LRLFIVQWWALMPDQLRLVLKNVESTNLGNGTCRVVVSIDRKGKIFTGEATAIDNEEKQMEAVAQATLEAIAKSLSRVVEMEIIHNQLIFLSKITRVVFLIIIQITESSNSHFVPGICLFSTATLEVAARATLNALNRSLARYA